MKSLAFGLVSSALGGAVAAGILDHQNYPLWISICAGLSIFIPGAKLSLSSILGSVGDSDD